MPLSRDHPIQKLRRKPPNSDLGMANAEAWRNGGYQAWKAGDAQREKELPPGGIAPQRPEPGSQDSEEINRLRRRVRPIGKVT